MVHYSLPPGGQRVHSFPQGGFERDGLSSTALLDTDRLGRPSIGVATHFMDLWGGQREDVRHVFSFRTSNTVVIGREGAAHGEHEQGLVFLLGCRTLLYGATTKQSD